MHNVQYIMHVAMHSRCLTSPYTHNLVRTGTHRQTNTHIHTRTHTHTRTHPHTHTHAQTDRNEQRKTQSGSNTNINISSGNILAICLFYFVADSCSCWWFVCSNPFAPQVRDKSRTKSGTSPRRVRVLLSDFIKIILLGLICVLLDICVTESSANLHSCM